MSWAGVVSSVPECLAASHQRCPSRHLGLSHQLSPFTCWPILTLGSPSPYSRVLMSLGWSRVMLRASRDRSPKAGALRSLAHPPAANPLGSGWGWRGVRLWLSAPPRLVSPLRASRARGRRQALVQAAAPVRIPSQEDRPRKTRITSRLFHVLREMTTGLPRFELFAAIGRLRQGSAYLFGLFSAAITAVFPIAPRSR